MQNNAKQALHDLRKPEVGRCCGSTRRQIAQCNPLAAITAWSPGISALWWRARFVRRPRCPVPDSHCLPISRFADYHSMTFRLTMLQAKGSINCHSGCHTNTLKQAPAERP